jgi:peptidoglycan-N-acetylglucosamine deacetylase
MAPPPMNARWTPTPLLKGSAALHVGAAAVVIARPELWPWALGPVLLNHLLLTALGLWPRSTLLGPNLTRLPNAAANRGEVALSIDDGPESVVTPRVLDILDEYRAKATFFCVGKRIEKYAELGREIVHRGHAIENHSYRHLNYFSLLGPRTLGYEVARAQEVIGDITGRSPIFFRAPAGLRSPLLDPVLARLKLRLASWTRRGFDAVNRDPDSVYSRLTTGLAAGDILLLHDGHAARTRSGTPVILEVLPRLLSAFAQARLTPVPLEAAFA